MSVGQQELVTASSYHERKQCLVCWKYWPLDLMYKNSTSCKKCRNRRIDAAHIRQERIALGRAMKTCTAELARDPSVVQNPHEVYAAIMGRIGGIEHFADVFVTQFEEACDVEGQHKPRKVILDYAKAIISLGIEAQKTAPQTKSMSIMTDEELGEEARRLAQLEMKLLLEEESKNIESNIDEDVEEDTDEDIVEGDNLGEEDGLCVEGTP